MLESKKKCSVLKNRLDDLSFNIYDTKIIIKPSGYLFSYTDSDLCFIGIGPIPDEENHYRLGTIFLRNFYLALDYENNQIGFAQNVDSWGQSVKFEGSSPNPYGKSNGLVVFIILFLLVLTCIALFVYWKAKKSEMEREIHFPDNKTRYKNGVEIKPSEMKNDKKTKIVANTAVNESTIEDGDD